MAIETINIGGYANDGTGDDLRTAFEKVNANFEQIGQSEVHNGINLGSGVGIFKQRNNDSELEFKTLVASNNTIVITVNNNDTIGIRSVATLASDPSPTLSSDLVLNGHNILGLNGTGDVRATVYGTYVPNLSALFGLLAMSNNLNIDMGSLLLPTGWEGYPQQVGVNPVGFNLDFGYFTTPFSEQLDFGYFVPSE